MAVSGSKDKLGSDLCNALGLKHVRSLDIHIGVNSLVTVTTEFYPEIDDLKQFPAILNKYKLEPLTASDEMSMLENHIKEYK